MLSERETTPSPRNTENMSGENEYIVLSFSLVSQYLINYSTLWNMHVFALKLKKILNVEPLGILVEYKIISYFTTNMDHSNMMYQMGLQIYISWLLADG